VCLKTSACGNAVVESDETCDDGNCADGDGCSGDCQSIEPGWYCPLPGSLCRRMAKASSPADGGASHDTSTQCPVEGGVAGTGPSDPCDGGNAPRLPMCGDGVIDPDEECDDGNANSDGYGGCTMRCHLAPHCGDGIANGPEECDLGSYNGIEDGAGSCTLACTSPHFCGDGIVDTNLGEECDLGRLNGQHDMGCDSSCQRDPWWFYCSCLGSGL